VKDTEDTLATDTIPEFPFYSSPIARTIAAIRMVPSGSEAVTASNTNYGGFNVNAWASDGLTSENIGFIVTTITGGTGNLTPYARYSFTLLATALPAGGSLTLEQTKAGTGVKLPSLSISVEFAS
jgi:hypothetical protein